MTSKQNDRKLLNEKVRKAKLIFVGFRVFKSMLVKMRVMRDFKTG